MLESLAIECGPPGRASKQKAPTANVAECPQQITHPLEAEHRIEEVAGDEGLTPCGVGSGRGGERGGGPRLGDALFEDLSRLALGVVEGQVGVDRCVVLTVWGVDLHIADQRFETEGSGLIGHDRHHSLSDGRITDQIAEETGKRHGGRGRQLPRSPQEFSEDGGSRLLECLRPNNPMGEWAAQSATTFR